MTTIDRFERELPAALSDVAGSGRPDYLLDILGRTARTSQRPAWASLERWLPVNVATLRAPVARIPWRPAVAVALVLLLTLALLAVFVGGQRRTPPPFGPAANGLIPYSANGDIFVGDPVTGAGRLLVGGAANDYNPTSSPDGARLAFLRAAANCPKPGEDCPGGEDVVVASVDGGAARGINSQPLVGIRAVAWAADSQALYVAQGAYDTYRLSRVPIDGGAPTLMASGLEVDWIIVRPPTGDELVVRGVVDGKFGLYRMRTDGSDVRLLAPGNVPGEAFDDNQDLNFPSYSPDGTRIYFNRYVAAAETIQAWAMNSDGSDPHRFNSAGPACCWWEGEMAPSPDGKSVLMWRVPPQNGAGTQAITLFPADGSGSGRPIGPAVVGTAHWGWSPDSTKVLLNFNDPAEGDEGVIDVTTGKFTTLPWNADAEPDWQRTIR
jgi:hypothetical protein